MERVDGENMVAPPSPPPPKKKAPEIGRSYQTGNVVFRDNAFNTLLRSESFLKETFMEKKYFSLWDIFDEPTFVLRLFPRG